MNYIGIDVSKSTFTVAYSSCPTGRTKTFKNTAMGIHEFMRGIPVEDSHCVLEATGNYSMLLVYLLSKAGIRVSMENPMKVRNFARAMLSVTKTDRTDARLIALYGERMQPAPYKLPCDSILTLKQKRTVIRQLRKQLVATLNLKGSMEVLPLFDSKCRKAIDRTAAFLEKQLKEMEGELASFTQDVYKKQMSLLTSIKGIGITLAAALIITTGGFTYFDNAKQLTRYLGLSPTCRQSGTSVHVRGHINRNGDSILRGQLYMAAMTSARYNTECRAFYERLRSNGKPGKVAMVAVANKLVRQAFAVVKHEKAYIDGYKSERTV